MYMNAQEKVCKEAPQTADSVILWGTAGAWWSSKNALALQKNVSVYHLCNKKWVIVSNWDPHAMLVEI